MLQWSKFFWGSAGNPKEAKTDVVSTLKEDLNITWTKFTPLINFACQLIWEFRGIGSLFNLLLDLAEEE